MWHVPEYGKPETLPRKPLITKALLSWALIWRPRRVAPIRSAKTQCSSRCWRSSMLSAESSARRNPQPKRTATMAKSRRPRVFCRSNTSSKRLACSAVSQFPIRTPNFYTPLTRRIPAERTELSNPSAASYARRRRARSAGLWLMAHIGLAPGRFGI